MPLELRGFLGYVFPIRYNRRKQVTKRRNLNFMGFSLCLLYRRTEEENSLPAITLTVKSEETVAAASILKFQQPIARSPSSLPRASPTSKLKIGTEKPTNEERGEGREGGGRRRNSLHPRRSSFPRPHTNSKSCSN